MDDEAFALDFDMFSALCERKRELLGPVDDTADQPPALGEPDLKAAFAERMAMKKLKLTLENAPRRNK